MPVADLRAQVEDWGKPTSFGASTSFSDVVQSLKQLDDAARPRTAALAPANNRDWDAPAQAQLSKSQQRRRFRHIRNAKTPTLSQVSRERGLFFDGQVRASTDCGWDGLP
jgi:hypothetical protein